MVAIGFAAAPAAADLDGTNSTIDSAAAEPVTAGFDSSEQDVQVKVTISDNASDNVTVDPLRRQTWKLFRRYRT